MKRKNGILKSLIALSLSVSLLTGCATLLGSGSSSPGAVSILIDKISNRYDSGKLTPTELEELRRIVQQTQPEFPAPSLEALEAIQAANDPMLNLWVTELTILCRQLEEEC